ncbi:MAG: SIS domain-containing protein [Gammaproteobacteria bacterium]|nr:SIS domain-containing protein [Gammaproteobacteria bacterium]MDE2251256.1 SIS domain-containing protein [Gammaproteobacteria bacterium]
MEAEAAEIPAVVARQLRENAALMATIAARLRSQRPRAVVTCARGSSDHAATYAKYLIETRTRVLTASAAPAIASVYAVEPDLRGCLFIAISQSGRSPDLLATLAAARRSGAITVALCNDANAPLCAAADYAVPMLAGAERSVAATKSYLASLSALAHLTAAWTGDATLAAELDALPAQLEAAWRLDWGAALRCLADAAHLYVIGRGLGLSAAQETALKCKETCGLHAEAYSGAEIRHGPLALLGPGFPALVLAQDDATRAGLAGLATELAARRVEVLVAGTSAAGAVELPTLPMPATLAPIALAMSAYRMLASLARLRGLDPDRPPHLRKVTETV